MKFSIINPNLNSGSRLRRCVGSIRGQAWAAREYIVVDGGSTDGTVEWL